MKKAEPDSTLKIEERIKNLRNRDKIQRQDLNKNEIPEWADPEREETLNWEVRDFLEERNIALGVLLRSASHVTDMQAATSHVQREEVVVEAINEIQRLRVVAKEGTNKWG